MHNRKVFVHGNYYFSVTTKQRHISFQINVPLIHESTGKARTFFKLPFNGS